jgi:hypothetical protein
VVAAVQLDPLFVAAALSRESRARCSSPALANSTIAPRNQDDGKVKPSSATES